MTGRGAFLVLEGCDRAGKTTQVKMLVEALNKRGIPAEARAFPNRTTKIGEVLNNFLSKKVELPPEAAHLLFSANRWECNQDILNTLQRGTTLVVDRYAASGAAYTAASTERSLHWCQEADRGLIRPDLVVLLKVSEKTQHMRNQWGKERFDIKNFQEKVSSNYDKLNDGTWQIINANEDSQTIHQQLLEKALSIIDEAKTLPIKFL